MNFCAETKFEKGASDRNSLTVPGLETEYLCTTIRASLAWPDPSRSRKGEEEKGGGEKEEGSGDSEQDVVTAANMAAEPIRLQ